MIIQDPRNIFKKSKNVKLLDFSHCMSTQNGIEKTKSCVTVIACVLLAQWGKRNRK